eukprot:CAMPEP_0172720588 /NCGR_PEP_ID=MMETSP1074-20121228/77256_1 /TAXON_ID=2916 /ORGANISM="Ceratium fusus, Strain PA161109" /LENGTH=74 /DNA_ID=CAMNT_0013546127 /DNA_START=146 /DNA_END=368 /DNA_ORIENTATION=+
MGRCSICIGKVVPENVALMAIGIVVLTPVNGGLLGRAHPQLALLATEPVPQPEESPLLERALFCAASGCDSAWR